MKTFNYVRFLSVMLLACIVWGCVQYDRIVVTEKPFVNQTSVKLYIGEGAGDRSQILLVSSPQNKQYKWASLSPTVAEVSQNGLVTALSEGFAVITVTSETDQTSVDVWVQKWVPLEDFQILEEGRIITTRMERFQIITAPEPPNASEVHIEWSSSDPDAFSVYEGGWVVCNIDQGRTIITAKAGGIEKHVEVLAILSERMPRTEWKVPGYDATDYGTIGYSSQDFTYGNNMLNLFDGNTATIWHTDWATLNPDYPHWFIVDLDEEVIITHVSLIGRIGWDTEASGFELFTCTEAGAQDLSNPDTWEWESQGEFTFDISSDEEQKYAMRNFPTTRYIKVFMDTKFRTTQNATFSEFYVYMGVY